jgi:HEAT repeat protein
MLRCLAATFVLGCSALSPGQLSGQFYLEKSTFSSGEPIFVYFQVVNEGRLAEDITSADPYSFCAGYDVRVSSTRVSTGSCAPVGFAGSCLSSMAPLPPGKKHVERLLLNYDHDVDEPGEYSVQAERHLAYGRSGTDHFTPGATTDTLVVQATLHFRVEPDSAPDPSAFQPFVGQLKSDDYSKRVEAARTLASVAPQSLEDTLLAFADNPEFRQFAPLAFHHLNTPRSMKAMANLLAKAEVGSYEHIKSADYLAESGDPQWFPLLLDVAKKHAQISNYVDDAAELGGDKMLPTLIALTHSPDHEFTTINAVSGMSYTGSRAAVPLLIELLRNPNPDIGDRARSGLSLLTHRTAGNSSETARSEYPKWLQWWTREGATAPIYKPKDCGDWSPLP